MNRYLKSFDVPANGYAPLTLRHLLSHTGGLDELPGRQFDGREKPPDLAKFLSGKIIRYRAPGVLTAYSTYGILLAALVLEDVSGQGYAGYLRATEPARIEARIVEIEAEMRGAPERIRQVKARTHAVLKERLDRYRRAVENRDLVEAQMEAVQEMLQLLRDQSYSMRDPRGITDRIDGLIRSAEETERTVKDLEEILALEQDALAAPARA